jgi:hypothetical protein
MQETAQMTCTIERHAEGHRTTLRLIGHLQAEYLEELQAQIEGNGSRTVLDVDEVTLVDLEAMRFLGDDGTNDLMVSDAIRTGELQAWFLAAHLVDTPLVRV